jgi:hypothetical protein
MLTAKSINAASIRFPDDRFRPMPPRSSLAGMQQQEHGLTSLGDAANV